MELFSILFPFSFFILSQAALFRQIFGFKDNRILPGGDKNDDYDDITFPNTPMSSKPNSPVSTTSKSRRFIFNNLERILPSSFNSSDEKIISSVEKLKLILSPIVTKGFEDLTEEGAEELLKLDVQILTGVFDFNRHSLLVSFYKNPEKAARSRKKYLYCESFESLLHDDMHLREYLYVLTQFYKPLPNSKSPFKKVVKAILKSKVFNENS